MAKDFESRLSEVMEHYELPYEPSGWTSLEKRMNKSRNADNSRLMAAVAAVLVVAAGSWLAYSAATSSAEASKGYAVARSDRSIPATELIAIVSAVSDRPEISPVDSFNESLNQSDSGAVNQSGETRPRVAPQLNQSSTGDVASVSKPPVDAGSSSGSTVIRSGHNTSMMIESSIRQSCAGSEIDFAVKNGPKDGSYLWNFGDGSFSNQPRPSHRYDKPGVFDVSLSVTDEGGRISTNVMTGMVTINPAPEADFRWDFVNGVADVPTVKLINTSEHANSFEWKFGDGSVSDAISPNKAYSEKGRYMVVLEVSNEWGCRDSKVKYVTINSDYNLLAPEKFNPAKEVFMPEALKEGRINFNMTVYNGNQAIFETSSKSKGWDGRLPDGTMAEPGHDYPWIVIVYNESTQEEKYFSGTVKVIP